MKRIYLVGFFAFTFSTWGLAQEIGVRFGDIVANDFAIDGTLDLYRGRLHGDVSFGSGRVGVEVLYDFLYRELCGEAIYWYVGVGGFTSFGDPFYVGASGEAGAEYRFQRIPLVVGFDWRPALRIVENMSFFTDRFGINVRWSFTRR